VLNEHNEGKTMTRNGKIARLPAATREELNQRLLDGERGKHLVLWLNGLPQVHGSKNPELTRPRRPENRSGSE
jgi:hypothetical protein